MDRLNPDIRAVLQLRDEQSVGDTARLGISAAAVKSRRFRGMRENDLVILAIKSLE